MKGLSLGRYTLSSCVAAAMLAGCGGSQLPVGAPGAMPQGVAQQGQSTQRDESGSWMAPDATSQDLLYVSSHSWVSVYRYPQGHLLGKLKGFDLASGQCVDSSSNVYVTDYVTSQIVEFPHGGRKRLRVLSMPGANGCSIDPTTGNLAVSSLGSTGVWIFKNAKGTPTKYQNSQFLYYYDCAYDPKGNLFVDGMSTIGTGSFVFAELLKNGNQLKVVTLNQYIGWPGGMQWDGQHLAIGDQVAPAIYQFSINGSKGTKVGTTPLGSHTFDTLQFWVQGRTVITSTACHDVGCGRTKRGSAVMFFNYPAGGKATKIIINGLLGGPGGDSVSLAPR